MIRWVVLVVLYAVTVVDGVSAQQGLDDKLLHTPTATTDGVKLVCYYSNWAIYRPGLAKFTPQNINPYLCTHLIYAFAALSSDFELASFDPYNDVEQGNYKSFVGLKAYNPRLKTMIAVGGWNEGSKRFSKLVESDQLRQKFIRSGMAFVRHHGFDGIDLDWEYPAFREGGNHTDKQGYAKLIKEFRAAIDNERLPPGKDKLLLSVAVPATKTYIDMGFDVVTMSKNADFLNVLTYDYHSAYEPETHHHSPLFHSNELDPRGEFRNLTVEWTVDYYLQLGCAKEKLVIGLPMYGRSYTLASPELARGFRSPALGPGDEERATREKGYLSYYEICQKVKDDEWEIEAPHPKQMGPYAFKGNQWVGFDDEEMLSIKARFIVNRGLGGAMVWTLDNDDFRGICTDEQSPLVNTIRSVLFHTNVIASSSSQQSLARSAGPTSSAATILFDDDGRSTDTTAPRRRNTLRRLVQNRQATRRGSSSGGPTARRIGDDSPPKEQQIFTTPAPSTPATPDPGFAFECKDEGFFNNPKDCKKYFWCLDSGPANLGVVAHAFTCPSGLFFNAATESCDYPENVVCPSKSGGPPQTTSRPPRPRARTTTTTTTETPPTPEEEDDLPSTNKLLTSGDGLSADGGSGNVAELLRLLQAIGGVEKLQSLLGSHGSTLGTTPEISLQTLPEYVTPRRTTPAEPDANDDTRPTASPGRPRQDIAAPESQPLTPQVPRRPQYQPDPVRSGDAAPAFDYRPPQRGPDDTEEGDGSNYPFTYNIPPRTGGGGSFVEYADEVSKSDDEATSPPSPPATATVPGRSPFPGPPSRRPGSPKPDEKPIEPSAPPHRGNGYRAPIRVQVVRRTNGVPPPANAENAGPNAIRRRMRVRVRPDGERVVDEAPAAATQGHQGRAVSRGEEHKSAARAVLVRDPNLPPVLINNNNHNDEFIENNNAIANRRQPVYPSPNPGFPGPAPQGPGVRFVSRPRRPPAEVGNVVGPPLTDNRNFAPARGAPQSAFAAPPSTPQLGPQPRRIPSPSQGAPASFRPPVSGQRAGYKPPLLNKPTTTTTTTTPAPPPPPPPPATRPHPDGEEGDEEEYDEEYEEYEEYPEEEPAGHDETTTTSTTTTTTTTTTTARPSTRRPLNTRRRFAGPSTTTTTQRPQSQNTPKPRRATPSSSSSSAAASRSRGGGTPPPPSTTTPRPQVPKSSEPGVIVRSESDVECSKRGVFIHPTDCSKFIVCAPSSRSAKGLKGRVLLCPANQIYLEDIGRCMKGDRSKCEKL